MNLQENKCLINIENSVYRLSKRHYEEFHERKLQIDEIDDADSTKDDLWAELLYWVTNNGKFVCNVETYNF